MGNQTTSSPSEMENETTSSKSEMGETLQEYSLSEESKDILTSKIQDLEFVESGHKRRSHSCCNCKKVAIKHRITNCDDIFCEGCYQQHYQKPCPVCRDIITGNIQDKDFEKTVLDFKVYCEFKKNGCQQIVHLGEFLDHVDACRLATKRLLPKVYKDHQKEQSFEEENAGLREEIKQLKDTMVASSKKQEADIAKMRKAIDGLVAEVPLVRQELRDRFNAEKDTAEAKDVISLLNRIEMQNKNLFTDVQAKITKALHSLPRRDLDHQGSSQSLETTFNWTISGVHQKLGNCKRPGDILAESEVFSIPSHMWTFRAVLRRSSIGSFIGIRLHFDVDPADGFTPFLHSRKYVLVDLSNGKEKLHIEVLNQPRYGYDTFKWMTNHRLWYSRFFQVRQLRGYNRYVKKDQISIMIILEPISILLKRVTSVDGILLWRIENYSKRKKAEVEGACRWLVSDSFYSRPEGYRVDLMLCLNGWGNVKGKGISLHPVFRTGEYDDLHSGPIKYRYKRLLMDQSHDRKDGDLSYASDVHQCNGHISDYHLVDFLPHRTVEKSPYLKDDALLIKIVIQTN